MIEGCREFARFVVSDKLHLLVELHLHRHDIHLDARFTFRLVSEAEDLHTPASFVHDQKQILAATRRVFVCGATRVDVKQLKRDITTLVMISSNGFWTVSRNVRQQS